MPTLQKDSYSGLWEGFAAPRAGDPRLDELTETERRVLELAAQGCSGLGIAARLVVSGKTVESHLKSIFMKLDMFPSDNVHRGVAVSLTCLSDLPR
jgi:DNA-binding NarL/FixJ family response regulator